MNDPLPPPPPDAPPPPEEPRGDPLPLPPLLPEPPPAPTDQRLPAHRVALRALISGPLAGVTTVVAALSLVLVFEGFPPDGSILLGIIVLGSLGVGAWAGLLVLSEQLAQRVEQPALRPPALAVVGAGAALFAASVVVWALAIYEGKGADGAIAELGRMFEALIRDLDDSAQAGLITLLPFLVIGGTRSVVPAARAPLPSGGLAALGGLLGLVTGFLFEGWPHRAKEFFEALAIFVAAPGAGGVALGVAPRVEARLVAAWERWRDAGRDG